jgi:hypothetical protein
VFWRLFFKLRVFHSQLGGLTFKTPPKHTSLYGTTELFRKCEESLLRPLLAMWDSDLTS